MSSEEKRSLKRKNTEIEELEENEDEEEKNLMEILQDQGVSLTYEVCVCVYVCVCVCVCVCMCVGKVLMQ
jgi:hypothetical protein